MSELGAVVPEDSIRWIGSRMRADLGYVDREAFWDYAVWVLAPRFVQAADGPVQITPDSLHSPESHRAPTFQDLRHVCYALERECGRALHGTVVRGSYELVDHFQREASGLTVQMKTIPAGFIFERCHLPLRFLWDAGHWRLVPATVDAPTQFGRATVANPQWRDARHEALTLYWPEEPGAPIGASLICRRP